MRHTHREIHEAKMLARNFSRNENVSVTPLSRFVSARRFVFSALRVAARVKAAALWRYVRDVTVCPNCDGDKQTISHVDHGEFELRDCELRDCELCAGRGEVRWSCVESYHWGRALTRYRTHARLSLAQAFYLCGLTPQQIERHERGLVPLDDWPETLRNLADLQKDREAAGHVSTT